MRYEVICHPFPINSPYLKTWGWHPVYSTVYIVLTVVNELSNVHLTLNIYALFI